MHANPSLHTPDPVDYSAPKKYVLVVSCVDARLLDDLVRFLDHDNLTNRYYHVTFAGASLGLTDRVNADLDDPARPPAAFAQWRQTFIDHVSATVLLTAGQVSDIYIVQHADCGAFRVYIGKDSAELTDREELELHRAYAGALLEDLAGNFCTTYNPVGTGDPAGRVQRTKPAVHTFFMDLRGGVTHLDSWPRKGEKEDRVCTNYRCQCPPGGPGAAGPAALPAKKRGKK